MLNGLNRLQKMKCIQTLRDNANKGSYLDTICLNFRGLKIDTKISSKIENEKFGGQDKTGNKVESEILKNHQDTDQDQPG